MPGTINKAKLNTTKRSKKTTLPKRYVAAAVLGRVVGSRLRKDKSNHIIDRAMTKLSDLEPLSEDQVKSVEEVLRDTGYWHGTGRYQISDGKRVDILALVGKSGKLEPQYDDLDFTGPMHSLSLARSRMYARVYADVHGRGSKESGRHGTATFWGVVFMVDIAIEVFIETKAWSKSNRDAAIDHFNSSERLCGWSTKVNGTYTGTDQLLLKGSDIADNYPIIFGIRVGSVEPAHTSRSVAIHETRSCQSLTLKSDITYIEVPQERVEKTRRLLERLGHDVPVRSIEDIERYVSTIPFSQLVSGNLRSFK